MSRTFNNTASFVKHTDNIEYIKEICKQAYLELYLETNLKKRSQYKTILKIGRWRYSHLGDVRQFDDFFNDITHMILIEFVENMAMGNIAKINNMYNGDNND